jgi:CRISPR-associated protein Cas2
MTTRHLHLVAYDVAHPRRLRQALHAVRAHATGGQKSAHECFLSAGERAALLRRLGGLLHPREDALLCLRLDPRAAPRLMGIARPAPAGPLLIIA